MIHWKRQPSGFSLVEVTLALGVAAFCLIAVSGLLSVGVQTNQRSTSQTLATNIMAAAAADLRNTTKVAFGTSPSGSSPLFLIPASGTTTIYFDASGSQTAVTSAQVYRLSVTTSNSNPTIAPTYAKMQVTWPAAVDPADPTTGTPAGSVETFAAIDLHN
jgi:uncharacterized protein (TIGR02598 family)